MTTFWIRKETRARTILLAALAAFACEGTVSLAGSDAVSDETVTRGAVVRENPYAPALKLLGDLSAGDKDAILSGRKPSAAGASAMAEISRVLAAGRDAETVDWGVDYSSGARPSLGTLMPWTVLPRVVMASVNHNPAGEGVDRALDLLAFARHFGREGLLVSYMIQGATENRVAVWVETNRAQLTPEDAERMLAGLETLPVATSLSTTLAKEKAMFIDGALRELKQAAELLSADNDEATVKGLRMTGIVVEGAATQIGFERNNVGFWLRRGQTREGVTLVEVEPSTDSALLKKDGRIVRLQLSSKRIARIDLSRIDEARKAALDNMVLGMLDDVDASVDGAEALRNLELALLDVGKIYDQAREHPESFATEADVEKRTAGLSPLVRNAAGMLPALIKQESETAVRARELRATLLDIIRSSTR